MASSRNRKITENETVSIDTVQIDGLAVLKIIKHCHEECLANMEVAQGVLMGLVVDNRLEITNCFPFPRHGDETLDEEDYQLEMMRNLRKVNIDHLQVGWYQSTHLSNFISTQLLESQYSYQTSIEESVVVIFDPVKTTRGFLSIKAYRLTPLAIQMYKDGDFSPEVVKKFNFGYEKLFYEVPVVIKNSHLVNGLLVEIEEMTDNSQYFEYMDLGTMTTLDRHLRCLMDSVDELCQESSKFNNYQKQVAKQNLAKHQYTLKRNVENAARQCKGEPPLPEEDVNKMFKPIPAIPRLDSMIISGQIANYCQQISQFASQSLGKLFVAESLAHSKSKTPSI